MQNWGTQILMGKIIMANWVGVDHSKKYELWSTPIQFAISIFPIEIWVPQLRTSPHDSPAHSLCYLGTAYVKCTGNGQRWNSQSVRYWVNWVQNIPDSSIIIPSAKVYIDKKTLIINFPRKFTIVSILHSWTTEWRRRRINHRI